MAIEKCFGALCFAPLEANAPKFFGFSEFLAGLALMVLAWTIGDARYRFRVRTAPIPLRGLTFTIVALIGTLTLLTDLWRAQGWLVPVGKLLTPASWQALLAGMFLVNFLAWTWYAFIRPPRFGKSNRKRYAETLYEYILKGDRVEIAVIADEIMHSIEPLIHHAQDLSNNSPKHQNTNKNNASNSVQAYANDLLLMISDRRVCRAIIESSRGTALSVFQEITRTKKYGIPISTFAMNIFREALNNRDSFLYHETDGYETGAMGYYKPLSQAIFGDFKMVEKIRTLLDPDLVGKSTWSSDQWQAYSRVALIAIRAYTSSSRFPNHSSAVYTIKEYIQSSTSSLYKINGMDNTWESEQSKILHGSVQFISRAIDILDKKGAPEYLVLRTRGARERIPGTIYDQMAQLIFEIILDAATVDSSQWNCWQVQHNQLWSPLRLKFSGPAGKIISFKLRRLAYDEITFMRKTPNFKGAKILSFFLNVMGLKVVGDFEKQNRPLHKSILKWTIANYTWLHSQRPRIAEACLVEGIQFDAEANRLTKTFIDTGFHREQRQDHLPLLGIPNSPDT